MGLLLDECMSKQWQCPVPAIQLLVVEFGPAFYQLYSIFFVTVMSVFSSLLVGNEGKPHQTHLFHLLASTGSPGG
jgi:hypothetical protein